MPFYVHQNKTKVTSQLQISDTLLPLLYALDGTSGRQRPFKNQDLNVHLK